MPTKTNPVKTESPQTDLLSHSLLQTSIDNIAKSLPGFVSRPTQRKMMENVLQAFSRTLQINGQEEEAISRMGESILVVEGPTGTGKSLGYLLPAMIAAKQHNKHLVVSSATIMLQEQLAKKDIPFVAQHAGLTVSYAIAKGRSRYACPHKLYQQAHQTTQTNFLEDLSPHTDIAEETTPTKHEKEQLHKWADRLKAKTWNGDKDALSEAVPDALWSRITNDRHGCLKRECAYYNDCPFFVAKDNLDNVDITIVNHDLLLTDLSMGGGIILPKPENTFYCIDEAHHLPGKAIQQFSASHTLYGTLAWLESLHGTIAKAEGLLMEYSQTQKAQHAIDSIRETLNELVRSLEGLFPDLRSYTTCRFKNGTLPDGFAHYCQKLSPAIQTLWQSVRTIQEVLKRKKAQPEGRGQDAYSERTLVGLGFFMGRIENLKAVWQLFSLQTPDSEPPIAKWIDWDRRDYKLSASPVRSANLLAQRLWKKAAGAVLTSATLRSLNSFEKLLTDTGLHQYPETTCLELPSPFNLAQQGELVVPPMHSDPKNAQAHTEEIIQLLPGLIPLEQKEGTLVLFGSKKQMLDVAAGLSKAWQNRLLIQGDLSKEVLIKTHFDRIAKQECSILFGLASFAEGLDLPGKACTHVVIAKIPFSMPDDPVGQTLSEWITQRGGNAFFEMSLPEASIRLIQAMGRLIRSETDTGKITLLDKRLLTHSYGKLLNASLPPFRRRLG